MNPQNSERPKPALATRIATVLWSVGIAFAVIILAASALLPSTKRARIDLMPDEPATTPSAPASASERRVYMPSSKSNAFDVDGQNVIFGDGTAEFAKPTTQPLPDRSRSDAQVADVGAEIFTAPTTQPSDRQTFEGSTVPAGGLSYSYTQTHATTSPSSSQPATRGAP